MSVIVSSNLTHQPKEGFTYPVVSDLQEMDCGTAIGGVLRLKNGTMTGFKISLHELLRALGKEDLL